MQGLILINKEQGYTSHDVVAIARRKLRISKIGHTGTLDPNATGLLVLTVGNSTKLVPYLQKDDKEYVFEIEAGIKTDTLDIWGSELEKITPPIFNEDEVKKVFKSFVGEQTQIPPMYSAIKQDGKKLYELAREGKEVERKERTITIYELELLSLNDNTIKGRVRCSSGTYVRTLCNDIAERLNTIGVMKSLVRTRVGEFCIEDAININDVSLKDLGSVDILDALKDYNQVEYSNVNDIYNGKRIELDNKHDIVLIINQNQPIAFYERESETIYKCKRGLW